MNTKKVATIIQTLFATNKASSPLAWACASELTNTTTTSSGIILQINRVILILSPSPLSSRLIF